MIGRLLAVLALGVSVWLLGGAPALAHADLVSSSPADGQTVSGLPDGIVLTFSEPLLAEGAAISAREGDMALPLAAPVVSGSQLRADVVGEVPNGTYSVAWRAVSEDGHPITGTFTFTVQAASPTSPSSTTPTPTTPTPTAPTPTTSTAAPSPTAAPSGSTSGSSVGLAIAAVVAVIVVIVAVAGAVRWRRSR